MSVSVREVTSLINEWHPRNCKTEKDFERSLQKHLQKNLGADKVVPQYASGRVRGDIAVDEKILIELKDSLKSTGQLQRLIGQLVIYADKWKGKVVVLICGESAGDLMKDLKKKIESLNEETIFDPKFFLVDRCAPKEKGLLANLGKLFD